MALNDLLKDNWERVDVVAGYVILKKGTRRIIYDEVKEKILTSYPHKPEFKPQPFDRTPFENAEGCNKLHDEKCYD
jgi:hypothetical protein